MKNFNFTSIFKESYSFLFSNFAVFLSGALPIVVIDSLCDYIAIDTLGSPSEGIVNILVMFISIILMVMFAVSWGNFYLGNSRAFTLSNILSWDKSKTVYLVASIKVFLVALIFALLIAGVAGTSSAIGGGIVSGALMAVLAFTMLYVAIRIGVVQGAAIVDKSSDIKNIWNKTKGGALKLFLSSFGIILPVVFVLIFVVMVYGSLINIDSTEMHRNDFWGSFMINFFSIVTNALGVIYFVNVYKKIK